MKRKHQCRNFVIGFPSKTMDLRQERQYCYVSIASWDLRKCKNTTMFIVSSDLQLKRQHYNVKIASSDLRIKRHYKVSIVTSVLRLKRQRYNVTLHPRISVPKRQHYAASILTSSSQPKTLTSWLQSRYVSTAGRGDDVSVSMTLFWPVRHQLAQGCCTRKHAPIKESH